MEVLLLNMLSNHRILILGWPRQPAQDWLSSHPNITAARIYQENLPRSQKRLKDLSFHLPPSLQFFDSVTPSHWYGSWKNDIKSYDTVILIDEVRGRDVFDYILSKNPDCRVCTFYDSPVRPNSAKEPSHYKDLPIHFFTCDRQIAANYQIAFTPYFYIFSPYDFDSYTKPVSTVCTRDVFFIGEEKGDRKEQIEHIRAVLDQAGLTHDLRLVPQNRHRRLFHQKSRANTGYMPYPEVLSHIKESHAVLELISDGQTGITQRPYEALFLQRKLITTSTEIRKYDFYHKDNIFILGEHPLEDLPSFLKTPFHPVAPTILKQYTLTGWLQRLLAE